MRAHSPTITRPFFPHVVVAVCLLGLPALLKAAESDADFFEKRIRPLLAERCEVCHSAAKGKSSGGLSLDTREGWQKGGDSGTAIVPSKPDESLLIRAVRYDDDGPQMPPKEKGGKVTAGEIEALVEWVRRGAPDPRVVAARIGGMTPEEVRRWWSFQKVKPIRPPSVSNTVLARTEIDAFVLAKLAEQGLSLSPMADRRTLLRRATFDLTGLPPTPAEVESFVNDASVDAFECVVDRLLASPVYGQRWARHWLDVVRYADYYDANPKTRTASCEITEAWRYRDWVVDSLNSDLPYDQFIIHQIAGDLLPSPSGEEVYSAGLIATTFLSNGVWDRGDADKEKIVSDMADDNIDTVGKVFLGLTLGCARCHDHKFDPILTEDYYALAGIFYSSHILKELGTAIEALYSDVGITDPYLQSAVEMACWDALGKLCGQPLYRLLGGLYREQIELAACMGIRPPAEAAEIARGYVAAGFSTLKMKGGRRAEEDLAMVRAIREAVGDRLRLRVDPNTGYSPEVALQLARDFEPYELEYFEQPMPADLIDESARLRPLTKTPLALNESVTTLASVQEILQKNAADVLLPDTYQCGGLAGVKCVFHCAHDFGLKTAAMLHVAASSPNFPLANDCTYYGLVDDILTTPLVIDRGRMTVPHGPGLGVTVDEAKLRKYASP